MGAQRARKGPGPRFVATLASAFVLVCGLAVVAWLVEVRGAGLGVELAGPRAADLAVTGLGILALAAAAHVLVVTAAGRIQGGSSNALLRRALEIDVTDPDAVREFDSVPELRELVVALVTEKAHVRDLSDRMETLRGEVDAAMEGMRRSAKDLRRLREEGGSALGMQIAMLWNGLVERVRGAEERSARAEEHAANGPTAGAPSGDLEALVNRLDELESDLARLRTAIGTPGPEHVGPAVSLGWQAGPGEPQDLFVEEDFEAPAPPVRAAAPREPKEFILQEVDEPSAPSFPGTHELGMEDMPFPRFVDQPRPQSGDRVQVTYQGPSIDGVSELPASSLLFEPESKKPIAPDSKRPRDEKSAANRDDAVFDLRAFGAREFES